MIIRLKFTRIEIAIFFERMSISFRYFKSAPEIIRSTILLYVRYSLSLRNEKEIPAERGIKISY